MENLAKIQCSYCTLEFVSAEVMINHMKSSYKILDQIVCASDNCGKSFKRLASSLSHIKHFHYVDNESFIQTTAKMTQKTTQKTWVPSMINNTAYLALAVADLHQSSTITGAEIGRIIKTIEDMFSYNSAEVIQKIDEYFEYKGYNSKEDKQFRNQFLFNESFSSFLNMQGQIRALKQHFTFIDPIPLNIHTKTLVSTDVQSNTDSFKDKELLVQYIPLIDTIKLVYSNEEVWQYIQNNPYLPNQDAEDDEDPILRKFEDGLSFQNNEFFKKHILGIPVHFYFDEFLPNNPIGSKTKQQKIGIFYMKFDHLPDHLRNFIGNVHVLAIAHENYLHEEGGMNIILSRLVAELRLLEADDGVSVQIGDELHKVHATLASVRGDTLAVHEVLGFSQTISNIFL